MRGWQSFSMTISLSLLAVVMYSGCSLLSQTESFLVLGNNTVMLAKECSFLVNNAVMLSKECSTNRLIISQKVG